MLRTLSIPTRIFLGFAALSALIAGLGISSLRMHERSQDALRRLHEGYLPLALTIGESKVNQAIFVTLLDDLVETSADSVEHEWIDIARRARPATLRRARHRAERLLRLTSSPEEHQTATHVIASLDALLREFEQTDPMIDRLLDAIRRRDVAAGSAGLVEVKRIEIDAQRRLRQLHIFLEDRSLHVARSAADDEARASVAIAVTTLLGLLLGAFVTYLSYRSLTPLPLLQARVEAVARGEFTNPLAPVSNDELGRLTLAFERMVEAIADRDRNLRDAAEERARLLRTQEEIVTGLRSGVVVVSADDRVLAANAAARRLLSLPDDVVRTPVDRAGDLARVPDLSAMLAEVRTNAAVAVRSAVAVAGRRFDLRASPFSVEGSHESGGVLLVVDDVTDELETKARLVSSERLAAIGRMAAHVTHEVRNPLSSIALNAEMLGDEIPAGSTEARELLSAIEREVGRLTALTEDYLRLARVPTPRLESTDVGELFRDVARFVGPELERGGIALEVAVEPPQLHVSVDEAQIRQVLLNLLRNAREAMPEGGTVRLEAERTDRGVELRVLDEGGGIAERDQARLFEAFFTTKARGTGLGLALSQQVVLAHGGTIRAEPGEPKGTAFVIEFPDAAA